MNVAVILAAGNSSRFLSEIPKQLYSINNKSVASYSIELLSKNFDQLVVITNSRCYDQIRNLTPSVLINDIDCRLKSIEIALGFFDKTNNVENILVHDAARPFISQENIDKLFDSQQYHPYSQFYLKLVNGLARRTNSGYTIVDREEYIELCTPQLVNYELYCSLFNMFVKPKLTWEIIPILDTLKIQYNLIEGSLKDLRKITTINDLF